VNIIVKSTANIKTCWLDRQSARVSESRADNTGMSYINCLSSINPYVGSNIDPLRQLTILDISELNNILQMRKSCPHLLRYKR
jgi:hypothetical protein